MAHQWVVESPQDKFNADKRVCSRCGAMQTGANRKWTPRIVGRCRVPTVVPFHCKLERIVAVTARVVVPHDIYKLGDDAIKRWIVANMDLWDYQNMIPDGDEIIGGRIFLDRLNTI